MSEYRLVYARPDGGVGIVIPAPGVSEAQAALSVPAGLAYTRVTPESLPSDRTFRGAWTLAGNAVQPDLEKARVLAHERRRAARDAEMAPHDDVVAKQIPGRGAQAEAERVRIRAKYASVQTAIDAAATIEELRSALQVSS